jgi:hypothetical protein
MRFLHKKVILTKDILKNEIGRDAPNVAFVIISQFNIYCLLALLLKYSGVLFI